MSFGPTSNIDGGSYDLRNIPSFQGFGRSKTGMYQIEPELVGIYIYIETKSIYQIEP